MEENNKKVNELENYWSQRYRDNSTGWDLGDISQPIRDYIDQLKDKNIRILVPGAGNGYEVEYLFNLGFKNTFILDVSELPLKNFKERVPNFPSNQLLLGDFFELEGEYDLIIEQTFFCSFPPIDNNRENYIKRMHKLLTENGKLVGLWFDIPLTGDLTKRPFGNTKAEYLKLFSPYFTVNTLEKSYNSISNREGKELFGILSKERSLRLNLV